MKSRVWVNVAIVVSLLAGLLGLLVGILNIFTHWCGEDCGSTVSRVSWGLVQTVAALLLLVGAYLAARRQPSARWVWIAAIVASVFAYFWAPFILVPVVILVALGVYALWPSRRDTSV